jgi:hypothetical protein
MFGCARCIGEALLLQMLGTTILKLQNILRATVHDSAPLPRMRQYHMPCARSTQSILTHTRTSASTCARMRARTHARTHPRTHARTHARTHTSARTFLHHRLRVHVANRHVPRGLFGVAGS